MEKKEDEKFKIVFTESFTKSFKKCFGGGWYAVARFFNNIYWEIRNFPYKFGRAFKWFLFMYCNEERDGVFLIKVIQKKLKEMAGYEAKYGHHISSKSHARLMRLANAYLNKTHEDDMETNVYKLFEKKYGELEMTTTPNEDRTHRCHFHRTKCKTKEEDEYASNIHARIDRIYWYNRKKYRKKAFDILVKYIDCWWD